MYIVGGGTTSQILLSGAAAYLYVEYDDQVLWALPVIARTSALLVSIGLLFGVGRSQTQNWHRAAVYSIIVLISLGPVVWSYIGKPILGQYLFSNGLVFVYTVCLKSNRLKIHQLFSHKKEFITDAQPRVNSSSSQQASSNSSSLSEEI